MSTPDDIHCLRITLGVRIFRFLRLTHFLLTLSIHPTWRCGFILSSVVNSCLHTSAIVETESLEALRGEMWRVADRKVSSTLQISAGAAATEEGGARQVVASQLQADI